jgi:Ca-activated chloride channel family protein
MIFLLVLPFLARLILPDDKKSANKDVAEIRFPYMQRLNEAFGTSKNKGNKSTLWFKLLLSLVWLSITLAMMRPQMIDKMTSIKSKGHDLMLAVDLSGSMKALDFSTKTQWISRLDVTKEVVGDFVKKRDGDRVGLIVFGDNAYMQVPLTLDLTSVSTMLNNTVSGMAGEATAIGDAIGLAVKNLRERPKESRVIILLTDGEDTASSIPPMEAAKLAKQYDIRVYTIGVGKSGRVPYPDGYGGVAYAQMNMDDELLKEIANLTNGKYFLATDKVALEDIYNQIDKLEKTESDMRQYMIREPLYHYPLGAAIILLLIITIIPLIRRNSYAI